MNKYNSRIERVWHRHVRTTEHKFTKKRGPFGVCEGESQRSIRTHKNAKAHASKYIYTNEIYYGIEMNYTNTYKYWNKAAEELLNKHAKIDGVCARRQ